MDNGDGTGASASISGSSGGSSNQVFTAPFPSPGSQASWTLSATRTGDGTVSLALSNGCYLARCVSVLAGLPALPGDEVAFQTTGGTSYQSVHHALAEAVAAKIQAMCGSDIIGVSPSSVVVKKTARLQDFSGKSPLPAYYRFSFPGIVVYYFDQEEIENASNYREQVGYPISIVYARQAQGETNFSEYDPDTVLRWRETMRRVFVKLRGMNYAINVTASGQDYTFYDCRLRGGMIFDATRQENKIDLGWLRFSFLTWMPGTT